jgi:hypothetical protein
MQDNEEKDKVYNILVGTPKGKKPFQGPTCRWEFKIKISLKEMWCECRDGIQMGQDTVT